MIYVKIESTIYGQKYHYINPVKDANVILTEIENAIENNDMGIEWKISLVEMSEKEYEKLPEFMGY